MSHSTRHDSGVSFGMPFSGANLCSSSSASSSASLHHDVFLSDSESAPSSPSSSVLSSPALVPVNENCSVVLPLSLESTAAPSSASPVSLARKNSTSIRKLDDLLGLKRESSTVAAGPTTIELSTYAASIIRNEAYALLALASRIDPVISSSATPAPASPRSGTSRRSSSFISHSSASSVSSVADFDAASNPIDEEEEVEEHSAPELAQSRSNVAFRECIRILSTLPKHGKIIVTGVGKSGIVGRKMVATFCSLGTQAVFLHPLEALHGDLGVICPCSSSTPSSSPASAASSACDALLLISHSGSTAELMRLLPIVRQRVRATIAITRDPDSILARGCTSWLDAGTGRIIPSPGAAGAEEFLTDEADSVLPAPTSSVVTALAIGDALALSLSRLRIGWGKGGKERRTDFLRCHPGGPLGIMLGREVRGVNTPTPAAST